MLPLERVPDTEPRIRVGIVLPEDQLGELTLSTSGYACVLQAPDEDRYLPVPKKSEWRFTFREGRIHARGPDTETVTSGVWILKPKKTKNEWKPGEGVSVRNVIAGRGFHWHKTLTVTLPDTLELSARDGALLLVNELPLETYLACVATSEMGAACPDALLESQTIVARSWMLANVEMKHRAMGFDVCNDDCCQRYQGTTHLTPHALKGAARTRGLLLMDGDAVCDARYSKSCGGMTESFDAVWGGEAPAYLPVQPDAPRDFEPPEGSLTSEIPARKWMESVPRSFCSPHFIPEADLHRYLGSVDESSAYFRWQVSYTQEELTALLNRQAELNAETVLQILPLERGGSGRLIRLAVHYTEAGKSGAQIYEIHDQYEIRRIFHSGFLYSSAFVIDTQGQDIPCLFTLKGAGWGHGVGYCQIGALGMALAGYSAEAVLSHYFPGAQLKRQYT